MQNEKRQYAGFDILKFICSILIVFLHINPFTGTIRYFSRAIANIGVPCFFIISGFLFFEKLENLGKNNKRIVLARYLKRMITLLCFWMMPYFFVYDIFWIAKGNIIINIIEYIRHVLFGGNGFFLWYIVSCIFAVLIVYLIKDINLLTRNGIILILFLIGTFGTSYTHVIKSQEFDAFYNCYIRVFIHLETARSLVRLAYI